MSPHKAKIKEQIEEKPAQPRPFRAGTRWIPGLLVLLVAVFMTFFQQYFLPIHLPQEGIKSPQAIRTPYDFVFDEQAAIEEVKKR